MNELIGRQKLIEDIEREFDGVCVYDVSPSQAVSDFIEIVDRQPPADQWIPCSERLPKESKAYEVTIINSNNERFTMPLYYSEEYKAWATRNNVIAWRERLEPYKGVE